MATSSGEHSAVTNFRKYLRIKSIQPNVDYDGCLSFLKNQATEIGLDYEVFEVLPKKPIVVLTWKGQNPSLSSILLSSHMDVVPVFPDKWKFEPFSAEKTENGDIYARGSQDMKCVGIQYLEAIRRLKAEGKSCLRNIYLSFSSDEEIGSGPWIEFLKRKEFSQMNVGFALDEGIANPGDEFRIFYAERQVWWVRVTCSGQPGHGSQILKNTAGMKLRNVINSFLDFRTKEENRLNSDEKLTLGDVTTVNLTMLEGGIQYNVVPDKLSVGFDIRIPPTADLKAFESTIKTWCQEAGEEVTYEFVQKHEGQDITSTDKNDPWWSAFSSTMEALGQKIVKEIFPAGTDSKHTRKCGIPAIGFSPMNKTPILLHDHNEYLNEKIFLKGIDVYYALIPALANVAQ
ncbi:aminoacylase-1-like [Gigantopelta aegis]|uniref:aminoacylase-1-like n=1 Tax=Gigantopelta aegis TaxID=1735272 RepID=UPI001B88ACDC|nr:aminoacylase-1-like [Gigantopelta aegis]